MEIKHMLFISSFVITLFLFLTIITMGSFMNEKREDHLNDQFERMTRDFNNMQILYMISESYGEEMVCLAFESKLRELDTYVWDLGQKIEKYRSATEEFSKDNFYVKQKEIFNENQVYYFLLLRGMVEKCNITKNNVLFFYIDSKTCKKCDDQSFVLRDVRYLDENENKEVAVFSFDMDLGLSSLELLAKHYGVNEYPCVVINEKSHCGIRSKDYVINEICQNNTRSLSICDRYYGN